MSRIWLGMAVLLLSGAVPALGQAEQMTPRQMLEDYLHFVRIRNVDVAVELGRNLLAQGMDGREFLGLVEDAGLEARFVETNTLAMRIPDLEEVAAGLDRLYLEGRRAIARDPEEIARNIGLLDGNLRARGLAREQLIEASQYAMPQLLQALLDDQNPALRFEVQSVIVDMGPDAVVPLAMALPHLDPAGQEHVAKVLGLVGYRRAAPFLLDVARGTDSPQVRRACERAVTRTGATLGDPAALYLDLAWGYFDERPELTTFPQESHQLLWRYDPGLGLVMEAIRTPVYHEAMAMRLSERSMELRPANDWAMTVWIAANFKREIETPPGYENPAYPAELNDAMFYAVSKGPRINQMVLDVAIDQDRRNTRLARRAIEAIRRTAGGRGLWSGDGGQSPLIRALVYPSRRVQYEAAFALGAAQPEVSFTGSERVVPTLAGAVRDGGERFALVVATDRDEYTELRRIASGAGYQVMPFAQRLGDVTDAIAEVPAVDLAVVSLPTLARTRSVIEEMRLSPKLLATPVLVMSSGDLVARTRLEYRGDDTVAVRARGISESMMQQAIEDLMEVAAGGPITVAEADRYAEEALGVLRDLAVQRNPVLDVADASRSLTAELASSDGSRRLQVADVLSYVGRESVQVALMDAALDGAADQQPEMLAIVADSAKRFGNMLASRQLDRLEGLVASEDSEVATASAALLGALNLPTDRLVPLVLDRRALN